MAAVLHHVFMSLSDWQVCMLEYLNKFDPDQYNFVKFFEQFQHGGFTCLVFEMLDCDLYDLMQERHGIPLSLVEIRPIAQQVQTSHSEHNLSSCELELVNFICGSFPARSCSSPSVCSATLASCTRTSSPTTSCWSTDRSSRCKSSWLTLASRSQRVAPA